MSAARRIEAPGGVGPPPPFEHSLTHSVLRPRHLPLQLEEIGITGAGTSAGGAAPRPRAVAVHRGAPPRVLIFSEVMDMSWSNSQTTYTPSHLNALSQLLEWQGIGHAKLMGKSSSRKEQAELVEQEQMFRRGAVRVCLLDLHHAQGWDLNYVTHVILLEPLYDKSLEEQVISRAHRIGTSHSVQVMTLVMSNSMEHVEMNAQTQVHRLADVDVRLSSAMSSEDRKKCENILSLKLIDTGIAVASPSKLRPGGAEPAPAAEPAADGRRREPPTRNGAGKRAVRFCEPVQEDGAQGKSRLRRKRLRFGGGPEMR